jgi:transglutaminase-like putative cysteine protease
VKYRVTHTTHYKYSQIVEISQNEARLRPRNSGQQLCENSRFEINPKPVDYYERTDYFGNQVTYFAIQQPHNELVVTTNNEVTIFPDPNNLTVFNPKSWENVRNFMQEYDAQGQYQNQLTGNQDPTVELFEARQYLFDSPMIPVKPELADYARSSFLPNRPLVEVVHDLMGRIYQDFTYDPAFTTVATPLSDVLCFRRGVCQDFAHLAIGCLRAYGIASRYVSGYLETFTESGEQRLVGSDASHAWFSVYVPDTGWLDFDPTNNTIPSDQHITLAWGRDYSDVTPLKGIAFGGGHHTLSVAVDVVKLP